MDTFFDRAFVVNCAHRRDRYRQISRELRRVGLPLTPGNVEMFEAVCPEEPAGFPSKGAHGCFMSHLTLFRNALEAGWEDMLIMEDDLMFSPRFTEASNLVQQAKTDHPNWGFLFLGHSLSDDDLAGADPKGAAKPEEPVRLIPYTQDIITTHCYMVNARILPDLVRYLEQILERPPGHPDGGPMHVDGAMIRFRREFPEAQALVTHPNLGLQRASRTDLHEVAWYDRLPVVREAVNGVRALQSAANRKRFAGA